MASAGNTTFISKLGTQGGQFFLGPIRNVAASNVLAYHVDTNEITYTSKPTLEEVIINGPVTLSGTLTDCNGSTGTSGQLLSSTGTNVLWKTQPPPSTPNLDDVISQQGSTPVSNAVTFSEVTVTGNLTVHNLVTLSQENLLVTTPLISIGSNLVPSSNVGFILDTYGSLSNVMLAWTPVSNSVVLSYVKSGDTVNPEPIPGLNVTISSNLMVGTGVTILGDRGTIVANGTYGLLDSVLLAGPPPAPVNVRVDSAGASQVVIAWDAYHQVQTGFSADLLPRVTYIHTNTFSSPVSRVPSRLVYTQNAQDPTGLQGGDFYYHTASIPDTKLWFSNYSVDPPNKVSLPSPLAYSASSATPPTNLVETSFDKNHMTYTWDPPVNPPFAITDYTLVSTWGSSPYRNTSLPGLAPQTVTLATTGTSLTIPGLYPGSQYSVSLTARDTLSHTASITASGYTANVAAPTYTRPVFTTYSGWKLDTHSHITGIINMTSITSSYFTVPVQIDKTIGTGTMVLGSNINNNSDSVANFSYNSCVSFVPGVGITILPAPPVDYYVGVTGSDGYYSTASCQVVMNPSVSPASMVFYLYQYFNPGNYYSLLDAQTLYYDGTVSVPTPLQAVVNLVRGTFTYISGIPVLTGSADFDIGVSASGMGTYFVADTVFSSTVHGSGRSVSLSGQQVSSVPLSQTISVTNVNFASQYQTSVTLDGVVFTNTFGAAPGSPTSNLVIIDTMSILPSIALGNDGKDGVHIETTVPPAYPQSINHLTESKKISDSDSELQYSGGVFVVPTFNYSNYWYYWDSAVHQTDSGYNYSLLSPKTRYATFYWHVPFKTGGYTYATFTNITSIPSYLKYRFTDVANPGDPNVAKYNTIWIDGTTYNGVPLTSVSVFNQSLTIQGFLSVSGAGLKVYIPPLAPANGDAILQCCFSGSGFAWPIVTFS